MLKRVGYLPPVSHNVDTLLVLLYKVKIRKSIYVFYIIFFRVKCFYIISFFLSNVFFWSIMCFFFIKVNNVLLYYIKFQFLMDIQFLMGLCNLPKITKVHLLCIVYCTAINFFL